MKAILDNAAARRVLLDRAALLAPPTGPGRGQDLLHLINRMGFVQIDSVQTVARAHHMILHARRTSYRPPALHRLLERDRALFEHWTHDAAAIPMDFLPYWHHRFAHDADRLLHRFRDWQAGDWERRFAPVLDRIARHGACRSDAFEDRTEKTGAGWWDWHPSKTALEYLWRSGRLAVCRREGFRKVYALADDVYPPVDPPDPDETRDWMMAGALDRLGFATPGELAGFWGGATAAEARAWCDTALARGTIAEIAVEGADGQRHRRFARPDLVESAATLPAPPGMARVLSPFDPLLRDRKRTERIFGFSYRIEIFTPAHRRDYGYYVFPLLEGCRLIGRIDAKADRAGDSLVVSALWPEPGVRLGQGRMARIEAALARTARLAGVSHVSWQTGWHRPPV